jgi:hypothetical protein
VLIDPPAHLLRFGAPGSICLLNPTCSRGSAPAWHMRRRAADFVRARPSDLADAAIERLADDLIPTSRSSRRRASRRVVRIIWFGWHAPCRAAAPRRARAPSVPGVRPGLDESCLRHPCKAGWCRGCSGGTMEPLPRRRPRRYVQESRRATRARAPTTRAVQVVGGEVGSRVGAVAEEGRRTFCWRSRV